MHPLLVLLAFTVAAVVTYAVVLGLLTAASVVTDDRAEGASSGRSRRGEHAER